MLTFLLLMLNHAEFGSIGLQNQFDMPPNCGHVHCRPKAAEVFLILTLVDAAEKGIMRKHHKAMENCSSRLVMFPMVLFYFVVKGLISH